MATGLLAAACMCLAIGQNPGDPLHFNYRNHRIPVDVPVALRPEIRELLLYASDDQGRSWDLVAGPITPDKDHFAFFARSDGVFWLRVVKTNRNGVQEPDINGIKNGPPDMKLAIDTLKPIIRTLQTQRLDDDVYVNWEVEEKHLDPNGGIRLEYQVKDAAGESWKAIPVAAALKGQARFTPGHKQPLTVRLTMRDLAKNESFGLSELTGAVVAAGYNTPLVAGPSNPIVIPKDVVTPKPMLDTSKLPMLPPPVGIDSTFEKPLIAKPAPIVTPLPVGIDNTFEKPLIAKPGPIMPPPPPVAKEIVTEKVIADSSMPPPPVIQPKVAPRDGPLPVGGAPLDVKPIANAVPARKALPVLQYVNQHQVMLEYELKRVGPSGIGGIEVWLTKDDGDTWEPYAEDKDVQSGTANRRQQRNFDFRDAMDRPFADGIYGLSLVVKSRAGLGKKPRPGDVPEIRIEVDTQLPEAQLYQPVPDPQNPELVLLKWSARDKNLADRPIHLEYAARPDGEWLPIKLDLENQGRYLNERVTGDFSWRVPAGTPVQVYLRMRVRDKAGNERVLVTPQPQFIDLTEPEGALIGVQPATKLP